MLATVLALYLSASTAAADNGAEALGKVQAMLSRLQGQAPPAEFATVANDIGPVIDELRQAGLTHAQLVGLRQSLDTMHTLTEQRLDQIEAQTHEEEAALEQLYRSRVWDDISFALGAFPYWRAWIDLELAREISDPGEKIKALLPAQNGFKAASMQLFRPGLVYGGWLGLGYVELEQGRTDRARQIFKKLDEVLAAEPDSPIREVVNLELRMLEAGQGMVKNRRRGGVVDANEITILKAEAFAQLQQSRKTGGRPLEAAERLKTIIDAGRMDPQLLQEMLNYSQELSGVDIGPYTDLAGAEFAMQYEHWYNAMQKYETFFKEVVVPPNLDLSNYRYRWALAAYKSEIYEPAIDILNKLLAKSDLLPELDQAASKLLYAIYATRERSATSASNRKSLRVAAEQFVRKNPHDAAADAARLMIAQTSASASSALQQLDNVSSAQLKGEVGRTAFQIIARDFSANVARGKTAAGLARQGIQAWQKLPPEDKQDQFNFAILLQMRALVDEHPDEVLKALDFIEKKPDLSLDIRRALVWSRLQLYDRMGDAGKSLEFVRALAATGIPTWQFEYLYPWIRERKDIEQRVQLVRLVRPAAKDQPEMDRRFRILLIEDLLAKNDTAVAAEEAQAFVKQYPTSGDAWKLRARTAEATQQPFEADRAWGVITDKAVPTMPVWWEGMLSRIRIRTESTRPDEACSLVAEVEKHHEYLPSALKDQYAAARAEAQCAATRAAL